MKEVLFLLTLTIATQATRFAPLFLPKEIYKITSNIFFKDMLPFTIFLGLIALMIFSSGENEVYLKVIFTTITVLLFLFFKNSTIAILTGSFLYILILNSAFASKVCLTGSTVKQFPKYGEAFYNGAVLAAQSFNDIKIEKHYYDKGSYSPIKALKEMAKSQCQLIIGFSTGNDLIAIDKQSQIYKIPIVSIYGDSSAITRSNQFISTIQPDETYLLKPLFQKLSKQIKNSKTALIVTAVDRNSMVNYKKAYKSELLKRNITVNEIDLFESDQNLNSLSNAVKNITKPDIIVLLTRSNLASKVTKVIQSLKWNPLTLGTKYFGSNQLPAYQNYMRNSEFEAYFSRHNCLCDKDERYQNFVRNYREKFKKEPSVISANAFDITMHYILKEKFSQDKYKGVSGIELKDYKLISQSKSFQIKVTKSGYESI